MFITRLKCKFQSDLIGGGTAFSLRKLRTYGLQSGALKCLGRQLTDDLWVPTTVLLFLT